VARGKGRGRERERGRDGKGRGRWKREQKQLVELSLSFPSISLFYLSRLNKRMEMNKADREKSVSMCGSGNGRKR
jgi:hypothetical protein